MERLIDYRKCTILYVDDEEKSLKYFSRAFRDKFRILSAGNASDAYQLLEEHRDEIGLLMIDQRLPGEKGVEFLQRARRLHPNAIRILTTAYSDFHVAIEAVNSAAIYKYVIKPWDIPELEMTLREGCEFFMAQRKRDLPPKAKAPARQKVTTISEDAEVEDLLTLEQVADYLNVNRYTVYRLLAQDKISAFKVGNQWRFKREMVEAWLMSRSNIRKRK